MRRLSDFLLALLLLMLTLPLWLLIVIALLLFSPGQLFYYHRRAGRDGKEFDLIKFRTMRPHTNGLNLTVWGDERITGVGRILRRFKLDELPQLLNVISGSMAFVGPRPESVEYITHYSERQKEILKYKPGLTDPASLKYRHEEKVLGQFADPESAYLNEVLPDKIEISLQYQHSRSFASDLLIILKTVITIFRAG